MREPTWRRYARLLGANPRADTDDELSFHLEMRVRDYMRGGMDEAEARRAAESRLGDLERVRRECEVEGVAVVRERRRSEWFAELRQDVRYGTRSLLRAPSFTAMAVVTLAIGIGATTAIFSLVHSVLLAPLPYAEPDRIVRVWETSPQGDTRNVVSAGNVHDWAARARSIAPLAAYAWSAGQTLTGAGDPERVTTARIQPAVLRVLGTAPVHGRAFVAADAAGAADVAMVSHGFWQERYGGGDVLDERIVLDGVAYTVIGVLPAGFAFPDDDVVIWLPLAGNWIDGTERTSHNFRVIGRLAPDATVAGAQAEMDGIATALAREYPEHMTGWGVNVVPLHRDMTADVRPLFSVLLAGVVVVLLIACGNLASLLLVRAVAREREVAVRGALGAGRSRIARQLITESVLLAGLGGAGALLIAPLLLRTLIAAASSDIPLLGRAAIDARMFLFVAVVALGSALLFGLAPVLRLMRTDLQVTLR
ncbi:MAG TPA: ABC transporter permease, partial [Longimicrobiales bacterium]|nr:ABC transporter permease [Longimicrobiales bacterium]